MNYITELFQTNELSTTTVTLRLLLGFVAGAIIGFEREAHHQPAGLKTHILICVGSTLIMLLSLYVPQTYSNFGNADPGRIAAQVVSGIGFIGAGAILRMGINVRGLTTAASIWSIAAIGLAIGAGMYVVAGLAIVLILVVLIIVEQLEQRFFTPLNIKILTINSQSIETDNLARQILSDKHYRVIDMNTEYTHPNQYTFIYKIGAKDKTPWVELTEQLVEKDSNLISATFGDPKI